MFFFASACERVVCAYFLCMIYSMSPSVGVGGKKVRCYFNGNRRALHLGFTMGRH